MSLLTGPVDDTHVGWTCDNDIRVSSCRVRACAPKMIEFCSLKNHCNPFSRKRTARDTSTNSYTENIHWDFGQILIKSGKISNFVSIVLCESSEFPDPLLSWSIVGESTLPPCNKCPTRSPHPGQRWSLFSNSAKLQTTCMILSTSKHQAQALSMNFV